MLENSPVPTAPDSDTAKRSPLLVLPATVYVYLALFILTFLLPPLLRSAVPALAKHHHATAEGTLSDQDFEKYLSAESSVRSGFYLRKSPLAGSVGKLEDFGDALGDYRALSRTTHAPNMDRRVLILMHTQGKPLDDAVLARLTANLTLAKIPASEVAAEVTLWRRLYGPKTPEQTAMSEADVRAGEKQIDAMGLHFLQDRALADLYHVAGKPALEVAAEKHLSAVASKTFIGTALQGIGLFGLGLAGLGLLIYFLVAAGTGQWPMVRRVATAPLRLRWGDLMDAFLFYLALYRTLGVIASYSMAVRDWQPGPHEMLLLDAGLQIGTGLIAVVYAFRMTQRQRTTLADIGFTGRGKLLGNIGYGIAGYCATLPLLLIAGLLAKALFKHNTSTTPNPVLPLMVGTHDPLSRGLIFLMASLAAPLFEEFFFRGVLFSGLRTRWGWVVSALISGVCFAVVHPMQDWLPIFAMGFTFATMREMRQSLVPSMTAHFLQNTLSFLMITNLFAS